MSEQIIVHDNVDFLGQLARIVERTTGAPVAARSCFTAFSDVHARLASLCEGDALLIGAAAPEEPDAPPQWRDHGPCKRLVDAAGRLCPRVPLLVLATEEDDDLCRLASLHPRAHLVTVSSRHEWRKATIEFLRAASGTPAPSTREQRTRTVLHIHLFNDLQGHWSIEHRGAIQQHQHGSLVLEPVLFSEVCRMSEDLPARFLSREWGECLKDVAHGFHRLLFEPSGNQNLTSAFQAAVDSPVGADKLRLIFTLQPSGHGLPVEALKRYGNETNDKQWYALHSPILRQYRSPAGNKPLFWDAESRRQPIDCLLIAADPAPGTVDMGNGLQDFGELSNVETEVDEIATCLRAAAAAQCGIRRVEVLKLGTCDDPRAALAAMLAKGPWHLVHFAGHSGFHTHEGKARPVVVLCADDPGQPATESPSAEHAGHAGILLFHLLTRQLGATQFLFVSSCKSATPSFLDNAIGESIPSLLGYRWPVPDLPAMQLAKDFYQTLFSRDGGKSLARALVHARRSLFGNFPTDATWASPLLLTRGAHIPGDIGPSDDPVSTASAPAEAPVPSHA